VSIRILLLSTALLSCIPICTAQQPSSTSTLAKSDPTEQLHERYPRYEVSTGDVMDVNFEFTPEFNQTVSVQPDGFISLKGAGDLHVTGDTVPQLQASIANVYSSMLHDPKVSIILKDFNKPYFMVNGQVGRPGKFELRGDVTVVDAVAMAGGFTEMSKHSQVVLFRRVSDEWSEARLLNVKEMLNSHNLKEDVHLRPGDMVYVPQNRISKIKHLVPNTGLGMTMTPANF
jgi:polysaccharide biosynthesis/export protein